LTVRSITQFPLSLETALIEFGKNLSKGIFSEVQFAKVVTAVGLLPPEAIVWADAKIAYHAEFYSQPSPRPSFLSLIGRSVRRPSRSAFDLLVDASNLAHLFLFHRDGYVREAALHRFPGPPESPFFLAALVYRLNDWVAPVRDAALRCAERVFPVIAPEVVISAAPFLLTRWRYWQRWEREGASIIDTLFEREDVSTLLVMRFAQEANGPLATELRYSLRGQNLDRHLLSLAHYARQPNVRAVALKTLLCGHASWPIGFERKWIDKRFNNARRISLYAQRAITEQYATDTLITKGLQDKSAMVRRVAADALIERRETFADIEDAIAKLGRDPSPSLKERALFLARKRAEQVMASRKATVFSEHYSMYVIDYKLHFLHLEELNRDAASV
jgi:hypothetical protein